MLWGEEAKEYRDCLLGLWSVVEKRDDYSISQKEVEGLVVVAILKALDLPNQQQGDTFDGRLSGALAELREKVNASPSEWEIHLEVLGVKNSGFSVQFAGVEFYDADEP